MSVPESLPRWDRVLAVVAHPDDESFGLGAVLGAFAAAGSEVQVLCLTRGEASTLHGVEGDLGRVRASELQAAAAALGIVGAGLRDYPDGGLAAVPVEVLAAEVASFVGDAGTDGVVVFDPSGVTGHPDHTRATEAAVVYAGSRGLPVLAWTLPEHVAGALAEETGAPFVGHPDDDIDVVLDVDRTTQGRAVACHASQAVPGSALWRRLELLGPHEYLRWIRRPGT